MIPAVSSDKSLPESDSLVKVERMVEMSSVIVSKKMVVKTVASNWQTLWSKMLSNKTIVVQGSQELQLLVLWFQLKTYKLKRMLQI